MAGTKTEKIFEHASDIRKFEIGLFWQRSLFFWGFIAAAFVAYAAIADATPPDTDLLLAIAAFGFVCSVAWALANRGSKYWQESWEAKLETFENDVLGIPLYSERAEFEELAVVGCVALFRIPIDNRA